MLAHQRAHLGVRQAQQFGGFVLTLVAGYKCALEPIEFGLAQQILQRYGPIGRCLDGVGCLSSLRLFDIGCSGV